MGYPTQQLTNDFAQSSNAIAAGFGVEKTVEQVDKKASEQEMDRQNLNGEGEFASRGSSNIARTKLEAEKRKRDAERAHVGTILEQQRQQLLGDLDRQIAELRTELADVETKLEKAKDNVAELVEFQAIINAKDFDRTDPRFIELAERHGFDPNASKDDLNTAADGKIAIEKGKIGELTEQKLKIEEQISLREQAREMLAEPNSDPVAVQEWLKTKGIEAGGDLSKEGLTEHLAKGNKTLRDEVGSLETEIRKIPVEEQLNHFEIMKAKFAQQGLSPVESAGKLKEIAKTLSDDAQKELNSTPEYQEILASNNSPEISSPANSGKDQAPTEIKEDLSAKLGF